MNGTETQRLSVDDCVVGAGLAGLHLAEALKVEGRDFVVFDKGRTPGGRMATRRFAEARFDHGLPWLTGLGPLTDRLIETGREAGLLAEIGLGDGRTAWYADQGISSLGKHLARDLPVKCPIRVTAIRLEGERLLLDGESRDGQQLLVEVRENLFLTMPFPQVAELAGPLLGDRIGRDANPYDKCLVGMARLPGNHGLRSLPPGMDRDPKRFEGQVFDFVKFPDMKPGVSLRSSPADSDRLWNLEEAEQKAFIIAQLDDRIAGLNVEEIQVMKWRYSTASSPFEDDFHRVAAGGAMITVCGDSFGGGRTIGTEAALTSARAAFLASRH